MSSVTTNRATASHRAQIVAEAVVSAYIHEITPPQRPRERVAFRQHAGEARWRAHDRRRGLAGARQVREDFGASSECPSELGKDRHRRLLDPDRRAGEAHAVAVVSGQNG